MKAKETAAARKRSLTLIVLFCAVLLFFSFSHRHRLQVESRKLAHVLQGGSVLDLRLADGRPRRISFSSQGLQIVADLYETGTHGPCIVLLHGSHELGRKQAIVLALAENFQKLGYTVLALDFRGFNDSEDPPTVASLKDLDFAQDVISAFDYLASHASVDLSKIYIVGHSFGAGVALEVMQRDGRAAKLVLIGPPRRVQQKILDPSAATRDYLLTRFVRHMRLATIPPAALCEESIRKRDISTYLDDLNAHPHIPILLIDGSEEEAADRLFLREVSLIRETISIHDDILLDTVY